MGSTLHFRIIPLWERRSYLEAGGRKFCHLRSSGHRRFGRFQIVRKQICPCRGRDEGSSKSIWNLLMCDLEWCNYQGQHN